MAPRGVLTAVLVSVGTLGGLIGVALAQGGAYQTAALVLEEPEPGKVTPVRIDIDYANPDDPAGKPLAVSRVVELLPPGTRIDTSAPEVCTASDAALAISGSAACPPGSKVGAGEADLDTGLAGVLSFNVDQFNSKDELILLFKQKDGPIQTPSRAIIEPDKGEGPRIVVNVPPIPGGPPDGFTAIKRVRFRLDAVTTARGAYVTTPATCPESGSWTSTLEFTYRTGAIQKTTNTSPCNKSGGGAPDTSPSRIAVRGLPRGCASDGFRARVRIRDDSALQRVQVRLDGRLVRTTKRKRFKLRVPAGKLSPGRHRVTVVVRDRAGNRAKKTMRFRRCR